MPATTGLSADRRSLRGWIVELLGMDLEDKHEIYLGLATSATLRDGTYWLEILFSAGIATLGLILNSPAVIIGAMLISPLMGPILANGLALAAGDLLLSLRALSSLLVSAIVAIGFATLLVVLLPFREITAEIAARTQPNTLDLIIAFFSGAVGSIAICKRVRGVATSIPGVAIAVALMPPLCVVGYGVGVIFMLDREQGEAVVRGGGLLFLTNLVAITFTAMLVFLLFGISNAEVRERVRALRGEERRRDVISRIPFPQALVRIGSLPGRLVLVALFIASLIVPLSRSLDSLKREIARHQFENRLQKESHKLWDSSFARTTAGEVRSYIDTIAATEERGRLAMHVRIFTSRTYSSAERAEFVRRLAAVLGRPARSIDLSLVEIPTSQFEVAARTKVEEIAAPPLPPAPPSTPAVIADLRRRVDESISVIQLPSPALLESQTLSLSTAGVRLELRYLSPREIDPDGRTLLTERIRTAIGDPSIDVSFQRHADTASIPFSRRETTLSAAAVTAVHGVAEIAARHPGWTIRVDAPVHDAKRNERLNAIRAQLTSDGIDAARISAGDLPAGDYVLRIVVP